MYIKCPVVVLGALNALRTKPYLRASASMHQPVCLGVGKQPGRVMYELHVHLWLHTRHKPQRFLTLQMQRGTTASLPAPCPSPEQGTAAQQTPAVQVLQGEGLAQSNSCPTSETKYVGHVLPCIQLHIYPHRGYPHNTRSSRTGAAQG